MFKNTIFIISLFCSSLMIAQPEAYQLQKKLDSLFKNKNKTNDGFLLYIEQNNQTLYSTQNNSTSASVKINVNESTKFNLGKATNSFVYNALLILESQNTLSVTDSFTTHFPRYKTFNYAHSLKLKDLISIHSTIADSIHKWNTLIGISKTKTPYSESELILIELIEKSSHQLFTDYVSKNILAPSGMINSEFTQDKYPFLKTCLIDIRKYLNAIHYCNFLSCEILAKTIPSNSSDTLNNAVYAFWDSHIAKASVNNFIYLKSFEKDDLVHVVYFPFKDLQIVWLDKHGEDKTNDVLKILQTTNFISN